MSFLTYGHVGWLFCVAEVQLAIAEGAMVQLVDEALVVRGVRRVDADLDAGDFHVLSSMKAKKDKNSSDFAVFS